MIKAICTTTIHSPSEAMLKFSGIAQKNDWYLIISGDRKTPHAAYIQLAKDFERVIYLSPDEQQARWPELSEAIGFNNIQRRNFSFLAARELNADIFASIDDDNVPYDGWGDNLMLGNSLNALCFYAKDCFDPIWGARGGVLWHRGFPLQLLATRNAPYGRATVLPDIQADFWNGDPDVDAICRMEHSPEGISFDPQRFPFFSNAISPFNSQNTFLLAKVMPHYFMYPGIGRMDDIWSSYHVQQKGFKVVYGAPSVRQVRNPHDLTKDMKAEYLGYEHNLEIVQSGSVEKFLPEQAKLAFRLYQEAYE